MRGVGVDEFAIAELARVGRPAETSALVQQQLAQSQTLFEALLGAAEAAAMGGALSQIAVILGGVLVCFLLLAISLPRQSRPLPEGVLSTH